MGVRWKLRDGELQEATAVSGWRAPGVTWQKLEPWACLAGVEAVEETRPLMQTLVLRGRDCFAPPETRGDRLFCMAN